MKNEQNLSAEGSVLINSDVKRIWNTLTNPAKIQLYLFESNVETDWKVGSPITFTRDWNGTQYQDKGTVLEHEESKLLKFSYWSSQEGYADIPENYSIITYRLDGEDSKSVKLTYLREKIPIEFEQKNQERYLPVLLENIKRIAEEE
jgi:uncharacterized protein YndB with AHSA1/START domain